MFDVIPVKPKQIIIENDNVVWFFLIKTGVYIKMQDPKYTYNLRLYNLPKNEDKIQFRLDVGSHILVWKDTKFDVDIVEISEGREKAIVHLPNEGDYDIFTDFLITAREISKRKGLSDTNNVIVKILHDKNWIQITSFPKRFPESISTGDKKVYELIEDLKTFKQSETEYINFGRPFKRNVLLSGPPGSGKSSIVNIVASELELEICSLSVNSSMTEKTLGIAISNLPTDALLVLEDIDIMCSSSANSSGGQLTLAILTNILDGTLHKHNLITIMTTTQPENLDDVMKRNGRIDYVCSLDVLNINIITEMVNKVWEGNNTDFINRIDREISYHNDISTTVLSNFIFNNRKKNTEDINVKELLTEYSKDDNNSINSHMFM